MMKVFNKNKNITIGLLVIIVVSMNSGCRKFLDTQRQGEYTAEDYPYPQGDTPYDTFLFSAYSALRAYNYISDGFMVVSSIRSDDADKGSTPTDGGADVIAMDNFPALTNGRVNTLWTEYYTMINRCNTIIDQIHNNSEIIATEGMKIQAEAEARFLRGYSYFFLVRAYGGVPKIDKVLPVTSNIPRSTSAEIYAFIEEDLQYAAVNLPVTYAKKFIGRPTKGAANGILAKVYLYQQKWGMAMSAAQLVMNSGQYDLSTSYTDIFSEKGENSKESVFEIQATASATVQTANGVQYASMQGTRGNTTEWNRGWGWNTPSAVLEAAYEPNDPRKTRTILYASTAGVTRQTIYGQDAPLYPTVVPNPKYNQKVLTSPAYNAMYNTRSGWWMNVRILRYADVVLMYAEAANELGGAANTSEALTALNSIRERARRGATPPTPPVPILPDVTTTDQVELRHAIYQERRIELAMEHERFFDIVRWGIDQDAMIAAGKTNYNPARDRLLPIPQQQRDLSKGILTQNPFYN